MTPTSRPPSELRSVTLTLPYPPSANEYWRYVNGRVLLSADARAYKTSVALRFRSVRPLAGDVAVLIKLYRPQRSGDLDNRLKICLDALQGIAFKNDSQVCKIVAERRDDKANPRVEIEVIPVERDAAMFQPAGGAING